MFFKSYSWRPTKPSESDYSVACKEVTFSVLQLKVNFDLWNLGVFSLDTSKQFFLFYMKFVKRVTCLLRTTPQTTTGIFSTGAMGNERLPSTHTFENIPPSIPNKLSLLNYRISFSILLNCFNQIIDQHIYILLEAAWEALIFNKTIQLPLLIQILQ